MSWTLDYLIHAIQRFIAALSGMLFYKSGNLSQQPAFASFSGILLALMMFSLCMWFIKKEMKDGK